MHQRHLHSRCEKYVVMRVITLSRRLKTLYVSNRQWGSKDVLDIILFTNFRKYYTLNVSDELESNHKLVIVQLTDILFQPVNWQCYMTDSNLYSEMLSHDVPLLTSIWVQKLLTVQLLRSAIKWAMPLKTPRSLQVGDPILSFSIRQDNRN